MAVASSSSTSVIFGGFSSSSSSPHNHKIHHQFLGKSRPILSFPRLSFTPLTKTLTFSLRKNNKSAVPTSNKNKKKKKKSLPKNDSIGEGDIDEDAIEALFNQLEEDLRNDPSIGDGDDELSEEELARLEKELEEALGDDDELLAMLESSADSLEDGDEGDDEEEEDDDGDDSEDDEEEKPLDLKNWQIRRLASALKVGRRKTSIKSLAAELGLDRALVLELLRDPPPKLLMISAALPDMVVPTTSQSERESAEPSTETTVDVMEPSTELTEDVTEPESTVKGPIHEMQSRWSAQKRLKKVQIETLERVYSRSKRPTNAMVSSIVHVTNLPRKRVVKWFEDKREEDGVVSQQRLPYQRSAPDTVFTS